MARVITIRHWLPFVTICPVNHLPDLIYVSVEFTDQFRELYKIRRQVARIVRHDRRLFMEEICSQIFYGFDTASAVEVRLAFNRHVVRMTRDVARTANA